MIVQMKMTWGPPVCPPGMEGMKWSNDENLKPSLINDTPEKRLAAIAACQQAFAFPDGSGSALPHAKAPWEEMSSDVAQGKLAKCGFGQLYCKLSHYLFAYRQTDNQTAAVCVYNLQTDILV